MRNSRSGKFSFNFNYGVVSHLLSSGFKRKQILFFIYCSEFLIITIFLRTRTLVIYGKRGTLKGLGHDSRMRTGNQQT